MDEQLAAWAASGAMVLTGRAGAPPLGPPAPLIERLQTYGRDVPVDPLSLLAERAAIAGLTRRGTVSCGGSSRLVRARDGWVAVTLAREDDVDAIPAWFELEAVAEDAWSTVATEIGQRSRALVVERAVLLGLAVAALPDDRVDPIAGPPPFDDLPVRATAYGPRLMARGDRPVVVDLSALWAGPLCTHLLQLCGARVIKVESMSRPDGARRGPAAFFDLLNAGKESVAVDFDEPSGRAALLRLIEAADVVVESSRPRALEQRGLYADALLRDGSGPAVWVSITGHGRAGAGAGRVAFGDDAAVAGGLVVRDGFGPCFCADAIADPLTGIVAAVSAQRALTSGERWLLDVALSTVASAFAGPTLDASAWTHAAREPRARTATSSAAPLGRDTREVLSQLP